MKLNEEQKKAVYCTENAVVAAGAGSGKTMVLANRFVWLITEKNCKADEILTLTFTKKAAAEMFRRIHLLLSEYVKNETGEKAARAKDALDNFIHARIQTLDSYSAALVKQCASRYGISPDFKIDPKRSDEIALEESLPFLIKHRSHAAVERLYADNRPGGIADNIFCEFLTNFCYIGNKIDFAADIKKQFNIICAEWENQTGLILSLINELKNQMPNIKEMCPDLIPVMEKYNNNNNIEIIKTEEIRSYFDLLLSFSLLSNDLNSDIESGTETGTENRIDNKIDDLIEKAESHPIQEKLKKLLCYISDIGNTSTKKGKPRENPVKNSVKQIKNLYEIFSSMAVFCMQSGFIISFMSLLNKLQKKYLDRKRCEGILTFKDIANLSRTILLEQPDIRQSEKEAFKAIMIDEFQDNNELQKDLLFLLAEKLDFTGKGVPSADNLCPGKLFFVGDEKQSIYLFRNADVSVFRKLNNDIKGANLSLNSNYRSVPLLIGAFNAIFGGSNFDSAGKEPLHIHPSVFAPELSEPLPLYEAAYSSLEAKNKGDGSLSICILNGELETEDTLSKEENEARFTAEKILNLLSEKTETGKNKYQPKDIAVLFRSHSSQYLYEKHLRLLGIPYACEDLNDLFYSGVINDILSVLRLTAYPLDTMAYAEMLRSPFAGLSINGTAVCLSILNESKEELPFSDTALLSLDENDKEKYILGQNIYSSIRQKASIMNISSLVSELWHKEGYRYETEWHPNTNICREYYDYLFYLAVTADEENKGLAGFTDYMCKLRESGKRLKDIDVPLDRSGAVHLLTIHKSKGLEYPVVFISFCGKYSLRNQSKNIYLSDNAGIIFCPPMPYSCLNIPGVKKNFFWEQIKIEEKHKRTAELRRLLYVAMTRAEERLFLTGVIDIKESEHLSESASLSSGDFYDKVKTHIKEKCETKWEKNKNYINGDSILDDDTFFGLILPIITSYDKSPDFFNLEEIPFYSEESIIKLNNTDIKNDNEGLNTFVKKTKDLYKDANVIKTPLIFDNHISPVSMKEKKEGAGSENTVNINKEFSGKKSDDVFKNVDTMLQRFLQHSPQNSEDNNEKFNYASFGTIAHICTEALFNGTEPVIPSSISGFLSPQELTAFLEAGKELAARFVESPLGSLAKNAELRENEFPFRSILRSKEQKEVFINGVIDLLFETSDAFYIVDFKTDSSETPKDHAAQMSCYYHAVSSLFAAAAKKQCRVWIYYLRTGHAAEITEEAEQFNLEQSAFAML
ncbi:MAG: UvrD-helicase domain-containing protein [Treponema sp.]|nr:UvrD-helicase domain-containing protein [Treponema sp.]